jgi:lysozyme family protein
MTVNEDVRAIAQEIVQREGGYVNDRDDPGGATNHGVTIHTMRRLGLDLNSDGRITPADVRHLTRAQAIDIFISHYFKGPKISRLPAPLHASVFDMYVNAGGNAVKILQRLVAKMGFECSADGVVGPMTTATVTRAFDSAPNHLADAYAIERRNYYFRLADKRAASRKYARTRAGGKGGWITRAETFMAAKYHLSTKQFQQRIAKWA